LGLNKEAEGKVYGLVNMEAFERAPAEMGFSTMDEEEA
jgi:hypothetical protein